MNSGREFYDTEYHYDEDVAVIDKRRIKNFFKDIRFAEVTRYLDIGCGVGWALEFCFHKGVECIGFDISQKAVSLSKEILPSAITTLIADGQMIPFADASFDLVSSLGTIEHFSSPARGLGEISRVTRKGGQVLLVVPNSYYILNRLMLYKGTEQPQEMLATVGEWTRMLRHYRLQILRIRKDIGPRVLKNKNILGIVKRTVLKSTIMMPTSFSYQFIFSCRKL